MNNNHNLQSIPLDELAGQKGIPVFGQGQPITDADLNLLAIDRRVELLMEGMLPSGIGMLRKKGHFQLCLLYTSPSPRDQRGSRMPSSA